MDTVKIGAFLAQLRREQGLTQEALGQKLGVTNKTVSRWETGTYMPSVEMLLLLSQTLHVSLNELLSGQRLDAPSFRREAEANLTHALRQSRFSFEEQKDYWRRKWCRAHLALLAACAVLAGGLLLWAVLTHCFWGIACWPMGVLVLYCILRNRMMIYIEDHIYGPPARRSEFQSF